MNIPIYDGCPIWDPKAVPFGFYNDQVEFLLVIFEVF